MTTTADLRVARVLSAAGIWGVYGPPGAGKTIDGIRAFPEGGWVGDELDMRSAAAHLGWLPKEIKTGEYTFVDLFKIMDEWFPGDKNPKGLTAFCVDELNSMVTRALNRFTLNGKPVKDIRLAHLHLGPKLVELFDRFRRLNHAGIHVYWNGHLLRPVYEQVKQGDGSFVDGELDREGGADFPASMLKTVSKRSDGLLRIDTDPTRAMQKHRPFSYYGNHSPELTNSTDYYQKDRLGVVAVPAPVNLAEVLRSRGIRVPRPRVPVSSMENAPTVEDYLEPRIAHFAQRGASEFDVKGVETEFVRLLLSEQQQYGIADAVVLWGIEDFRARVELAKSQTLAARLASMGIHI